MIGEIRMYCRTCGNQMNDNAEICVKCGVRKNVGNDYCQNCGAKTLEQAELCTECGSNLIKASLNSMTTFNAQTIIKNKGVVKIVRIIGMVALVLGILLIIKSCLGFIIGFFNDIEYYIMYEGEDTFKALLLGVVFTVIGKIVRKKFKKE